MPNPGARIVADLIPKRSVGVEIGVWEGASSELFLARADHLHLVDPWSVFSYADIPEHIQRYAHMVGSHDIEDFRAYYDAQYRRVLKRLKGRSVTIHRVTSAEFFRTFTGRVDWVYIDGLHDYENVKADLHGARSILKPGGVIYGDDYGNKPGVAQAVDEFAPQRKLLGMKQYAIAGVL